MRERERERERKKESNGTDRDRKTCLGKSTASKYSKLGETGVFNVQKLNLRQMKS